MLHNSYSGDESSKHKDRSNYKRCRRHSQYGRAAIGKRAVCGHILYYRRRRPSAGK
jgi:hypothetical protein